MANTFTPPSWREDQPWAIEQGLANTLGARSPNLAETMLTRYGLERQANQGAYHDYMRAINALQQQNMQFNQDELLSKNALEAGKLAGAHSGGAAFVQGNPYLSSATQGDMSGLEAGALANERAKQIHDSGLGFGGMAAGGVAPTSAQIGSIIPQAAGMQVNPPAIVQAAQLNADSRRDAAAIGSSNKYGDMRIPVTVEPKSAARPEGLTGSITIPPNIRAQGPAAISAYVHQLENPRTSRATDKTTPYSGEPDATNPLLGGIAPPDQAAQPSATPQRPASGQTAQQGNAAAMSIVGQWSMGPNVVNRAKAKQIMEFANKSNGGQIKVDMVNGKLVATGVNDVGQVVPYRLQ